MRATVRVTANIVRAAATLWEDHGGDDSEHGKNYDGSDSAHHSFCFGLLPGHAPHGAMRLLLLRPGLGPVELNAGTLLHQPAAGI